VGGSGNSLERSYHYSVENDLNFSFTAQRTSNTSVGLINLFERHDKPWMKGRFRNMNLWLDPALLRRDMSHMTHDVLRGKIMLCMACT
jgi:hypothetical protein